MRTDDEDGLGNYPHRDELSANVALVLRLRQVRQLHPAVARQVVKSACWWASNALGKYDQCRHWSEAAAEKRATSISWSGAHHLVHEHVIPRKYIEDAILALTEPAAEEVKGLLALSFICIVTKEEDALFGKYKLRQNMPKGWLPGDDVWTRYAIAGIKRKKL